MIDGHGAGPAELDASNGSTRQCTGRPSSRVGGRRANRIATNALGLAPGVQVRGMGVEDKRQGDVVFEQRLERADQEGEPAGGVGDVPDQLVASAGETGLGYLYVGGVVTHANETELDRRRVVRGVAAPGKDDPAVLLYFLDGDPARDPVHLPFPDQLGSWVIFPLLFVY